ncbi:uncharacterized protein LOC126900022 [Daktulosphaira vitifoliae]|uniref:uncharacterized protein LOC126900022 n=1 Tax=Daktulosphaira vitifoliae TaxID=58002 RepID=UPI0021AA0D57|nr:uncharacterized protein LOC126900022 [Daktulosphaira vitifoliae]
MLFLGVIILQAILVSANSESRSIQSVAPNSPTNYIITSKPFTVKDDANAGTIKWRRDTITGASLIGASDPAKLKYSIECADNNECANIDLGGSSDATFKPYTQDELNRILKRYGEATPEAESSDKVLSYDDSGNQDKSKATWNLADSQQGQKNPYDDRQGWVTLEPVAWSSSHIQKWEPNNRPTWPPPPQDNHSPSYSPWANNRPINRPSSSYHQQQSQSEWTTERPWIRPTYNYAPSTPHVSQYQKPVSSQGPQNYYGGWNNAEPDIITDGKPGQFPADVHKPWNGDYGQQSYGPRPSEVEGDGQWVLLSSTKGYSIPHRPNRSLQSRSMSFDTVNKMGKTNNQYNEIKNERLTEMKSQPISSKRTVRLMVLPPDKDSHNTTTSHNGMIEVDISRKSVDQEQKEFAARALKESENDVQVFSDRSVKSNNDHKAVLAAVGAGMLPAATMAMFLPMMVNRKRRDISSRPQIILHHHHMFPR